MKYRRIYSVLFLSFGISTLFAQQVGGSLKILPNNNAVQLIKEVFLKGNCTNVSNITASGQPVSFGEFDNAGNVIGLPDGLILSSGNVKLAEGPNERVDASDRFAKISKDDDLSIIATNQLFDVTVIEFDFVPLSDEVSFQYVFASEEYCEFVGTIFNDVFGFFVSGPGINGEFNNGAINVARLPDSEEFVSINTVNHFLNDDVYVQNELEADALSCGIPFSPSHLNTIEFDGFTVPLVARFSVIPCETYHIRLVVGDVGDDKLDSAVFLQAKSFDLGELATVKAVVPNRSDSIVYEACIDGQFVFTRPSGTRLNEPFPVDFTLSEMTTALEGIDFQGINRTIMIPAGQNSFVLPIETLVDGEVENLETLTIELQQICKCEDGSIASLFISDANPPTLNLPPLSACANQDFTLKPQITGGVAPFNFEWDNSTSDSILVDNIQTTAKYKLTITDICQNTALDSIEVNIQPIPTAMLTGELDYCEGKPTGTLPLTFSGLPPWSFTYLIGDSTKIVDNIFDENLGLPVNQAGIYELIAFQDAGCLGIANGTGVANDIGIDWAAELTPPICPNNKDGSIDLTIISGAPPYDINWSLTVNDPFNPINLSAGAYQLTISDNNDCSITTQINLPNPANIPTLCFNNAIYIPNVFSPNGDGENDFFEIFLPKETNIEQILEVQILDRWGNLVFLSKENDPKWDGKMNGQILNPGVFFYSVLIALKNGDTQLNQGDVTLWK